MADEKKKPERELLATTMSIGELKATHELYDKYLDEWKFLNAAYEGIRELIAFGAMWKHERESPYNYERRLAQAYGFTYSGSIVELINSYLFKKEYPKSIPESLGNSEEWKEFQRDCDLEETGFDEFFINSSRDASIQGHVGLLVDRPNTETETVAEEKELNIYPYLAEYKPPAILDWKYERDPSGRKKLVFLKLYDDDGYYRIWSPDEWQIWEVIEEDQPEGTKIPRVSAADNNARLGPGQTSGVDPNPPLENASLMDSGPNPLGEIPFTWLYNKRHTVDKQIGASDISDISRTDASIMRNLSQIEEIIDYAAFPMMRRPMKEGGGETQVPSKEDEVGTTAILEFDPEHPESKPDWLRAEVEGPIKAILEVISTKVSELYRSSNVGGMASMEIQKQARSGVALKAEFQLLNSKLVKKALNVVKAKRSVVRFWLMWQDVWEKYRDDIQFDPIKTFEVEDLAADLENLLTSKIIVTLSPTFEKEVQKMTARRMLPTDNQDAIAEVEAEIDEAEIPTYPPEGEGGAIPTEEDLQNVA